MKKLDEKLLQRVQADIAAGLDVPTIAKTRGVHKSTVYAWKRKHAPAKVARATSASLMEVIARMDQDIAGAEERIATLKAARKILAGGGL